MGWETLDHGLGWGAASGVTLNVGEKARKGRVAAGKERGSLGTKVVLELVLGREVIDGMGLTLIEDDGDQYIKERLALQWGTGSNLGTILLRAMRDQGLPGLEMRCQRKATVFKVRSDKLPRTYAGVKYEQEDCGYDVNADEKACYIYLPDDFFAEADEVRETVRAVPVPPAIPAPLPADKLASPQLTGKMAALPAALRGPDRMLVKQIEVERYAHKVVPGFDVDPIGNYFIETRTGRDRYTVEAILRKVNDHRAKHSLPIYVIEE